MKGITLVCVIVLALVMPAFSQPDTAPPPIAESPAAAPPTPVQPPSVPAVAPPTPPAPGPAAGAPTATPNPRWVTEQYPPWALEFLEDYPRAGDVLSFGMLYAKPLLFVGLLLFTGLMFGSLVRRITMPEPVDATRRGEGDTRATRRAAVGDVVVWAAALVVACEATGLHWAAELSSILIRLVTAIGTAIVWIVVGGLVAYSLSAQGRDLVLSLLGWYYLERHPGKPDRDQEFDLGGGKKGKIKQVGPLHTTFGLGDGRTEMRPNAWLMKTHFNWGPGPGAVGGGND